MAGRNYPRLKIEDFGRALLSSGDLDPIYIALLRSGYPEEQMHRWLIAYWCYYSAGVASFMSEAEGHEFWRWMEVAALNEEETPAGGRWERGHERRHFRAKIAQKSISALRARYGGRPEDMVDYIAQPIRMMEPVRHGTTPYEPLEFRTVSARAQEHYAFGPWIGFKIADMVDRCLGVPVKFDNAHVFMFEDPEEAALKLWRLSQGLPETAKPKDKARTLELVTHYLITTFDQFKAPPLADRPVNIQEVETILCKWKSHMNGHYPLNNDIDEINAGLERWKGTCAAARAFAAAMPSRKD